MGYSGASLAEIARRAQVSKGVVLYYFDGKDDLLQHVVLDVYTRAGSAIETRLSVAPTASAKVAGYVEANLQFVRTHTAEVRAVVEIVTNAPRPDGGRKFAPKDKDRVLAYFEELLPDGQSSGEFGSFATLPLDLVPIASVGLLIMMLVLMNEAVKRHGRRAKRDTSGI